MYPSYYSQVGVQGPVDDEKLIVKGIRFSLEQDGMEVGLCL